MAAAMKTVKARHFLHGNQVGWHSLPMTKSMPLLQKELEEAEEALCREVKKIATREELRQRSGRTWEKEHDNLVVLDADLSQSYQDGDVQEGVPGGAN